MQRVGNPVYEARYGPIELWARRIGTDEVLWHRELFEQGDQLIDWPGNMVRHEDYLYLAGGEAGTVIFDMSDPAEPELVNVLNWDNSHFISNITNIGERLLIYHLGFDGQFLRLFDISNPEEPEYLGMFDLNDPRYPYDYDVENVTYNGCVFFPSRSRVDSSSILVLDITSDDAPREAAIINLGRDLDIFYIYISDDCLFITPFRSSYVDIYNINDNYEIEHVATVSPERTPDGQFLVHDNKLIFSTFYAGNPEEGEYNATYIYENPPVSVSSPPTLHPSSFSISTYPNPFNSTTTVNYSIPKAGDVSLKLYDISGRLAGNLISGKVAAGNHAIVWDASDYPTGVYFCRINAGGFMSVKKMTLIR